MSGNEVTFNGKGAVPFAENRHELAQIIRQRLRSSASYATASFPLAVRSENTTDIHTADSESAKSSDKGFNNCKVRSSLSGQEEDLTCSTHQFRVELERLHDKNNKLEQELRQKNNEIERLNGMVRDLQSKHLFNLQALDELRCELVTITQIQQDLKSKPNHLKDQRRKIERRNSSICSTANNSRYSTPIKSESNTREMTGKYSGIFFIPEYVTHKQRSQDDMGKQEQCMPFLSRSNHNWMASLRGDPPSPIKSRPKTVKENSMKPVALNFTPKFSYGEAK